MDHIRRLGWIRLSIALLAVAGLRFFLINPRFEFDTRALLSGSRAAAACIKAGQLSSCPNVQHFPLFQYLPGMALQAVGLTDGAPLHLFAILNMVLFFGLLSLFWMLSKKCYQNVTTGSIGILIIITGPLLWYASSTFNELTSAFMTVLLLYLIAVNRSPFYIFLAFTAAGTTKEIAFPFLLLCSVLVLMASSMDGRKTKSTYLTLGLGVLVTIFINGAFNWFRFGTLFNVTNLQAKFMAPSFAQQLSSGLAIWFSPSGGLLFFWPSFVLLLFWCLWRVFLAKTAQATRQSVAIAIAVIIMLIALTLGFASWYAPLGWVAWGPRLILTWLPAILFILLLVFSGEINKLFMRLTKTPSRTAIFLAIMLVLALPQLLALFAPHAMENFFALDSVCSRPVFIEEQDYYYACLNHGFWTKWPLILRVFDIAFKPIVFVHIVIYMFGIGSIVRYISNQR